MEDSAYENSLRLTNIALLLSGIRLSKTKWSRNFESFYDKYFYSFNFIWLYMDVGGEIWWLIDAMRTGKNFLELSLATPCVTVSLLATSKSIFLYLNRDILIRVVDKLREIHPKIDEENVDVIAKEFAFEDIELINTEDNKKSEAAVESRMLHEATRFLKFVVLLQYYICAVVIVAFPIMPVSTMIYDFYVTGSFEYKYPYLVKYFFDPYTMELWPYVYLHQVVSTIIVGLSVFGADTLFYALCIYIRMHFGILCHRFENVVSGPAELTRRQLSRAIRRHQDLINLVDQMELLYTKSTLFNIVTSSVLICLSGFVITTMDDVSVVITFATFLFMNLSQISLLCFFGDMLMRSSTQISSAVYNSYWYQTDQDIKKSMFFILKRAQKPCKLTAYKFADLNLTAFTTILSRSWSYFALLKTIYK